LQVTTTVVARVAVGPMTDKYGPKIALTVLLLLGAIPVFCFGSIKNWKGT
jgi:nitrate/nitrite transporter NarK